MKSQLELLRSQCPPWATVAPAGQALKATVHALPSGKPYGPIDLLIKSSRDTVAVEEGAKPTRWPVGCPERHINHDGTFCIGEGPINAPRTAGDATIWWEAVGKFLLGQRHADRHRRWLYPRSFHHGSASKHQRKLEELAKGTSFEADVEYALHSRSGWLSGDIPRVHPKEARLTNLRAPCPRGCMRRGRPILRHKCKQRQLMFEIVREETARRKAEKSFWDHYPRKVCCGSMDHCPLQLPERESS